MIAWYEVVTFQVVSFVPFFGFLSYLFFSRVRVCVSTGEFLSSNAEF
jgi:hypothetical protein